MSRGPLVVVGDALLDIDLVGSVNRVCPDAPAPVLDLDREEARPGGAGLAAVLAARCGPVVLVTAIADDEPGYRLARLLRQRVHLVAGPSRAATSVKTRLRTGDQSLARVDRGGGPPAAVTDEMLAAVRSAAAVLVSDYGRGITRDRRLRALLARLAREIPVLWDPHPRGPSPVPGVGMVTPNAAEAERASGVPVKGFTAAERAAARLCDAWRADAVTITMSMAGALLHNGSWPLIVPAPRVYVADPCGAGDCFAATTAARLRAGQDDVQAVTAAVTAASEFLATGGVSALDLDVSDDMSDVDGIQRARVPVVGQ